MKKILVASPVRGGCSPTYVKTIMALLFSKINKIFGGPDAPYDFQWAATSGTSVAMARDELAHLAIQGGFDKLVFWDIDLGSFDSKETVAMFARLLSHDVAIVAGQYVGHNFEAQFHGAVAEGAALRRDGLMEMAQIPLGFSAIDVKEGLLKIKEAHPNRLYNVKQTQDIIIKPGMFEFFPNGIIGPCSDEGKLARIKEVFSRGELPANHDGALGRYFAIEEILNDARYEGTYMLGEDFYFCKLAREAGVPLYIDNNLIVPHDTNVRLPVRNEVLLKALMEEWRWDDKTGPGEIAAIVDTLGTKLGKDHL